MSLMALRRPLRSAARSHKRTLLKVLPTAVSAPLVTSAPGTHPDKFAVELVVDCDPKPTLRYLSGLRFRTYALYPAPDCS